MREWTKLIEEGSGVVVKGPLADQHTRCIHYHSRLDIIAIKFKCCNTYYPCYQCHDVSTKCEDVTSNSSIKRSENGDKKALRWNRHDLYEKQEKVIFCGNCYCELTFGEYAAGSKCPKCNSDFNPGCSLHYHLYFDLS